MSAVSLRTGHIFECDVSAGIACGTVIQTKLKPNKIDLPHIARHLRSLDDESADTQRLIVLTPDATELHEIQEIDDARLVWMSFDGLVSALEGLLSRDEAVSGDETRPPTEREAFLRH